MRVKIFKLLKLKELMLVNFTNTKKNSISLTCNHAYTQNIMTRRSLDIRFITSQSPEQTPE